MRTWVIYKVLSPSGKIYIGQTSKDLNKRKSEHEKEAIKPKYKNNAFKRAILKYGNLLVWSIIESNIKSLKQSHKREQYWIRRFDSANSLKGYNSTLGGSGVIPTLEVRAKISASVKKANKTRFSCPKAKAKQSKIAKSASRSPSRIPNLKKARSSKSSRAKTSADLLIRYSDQKARDVMSLACGGAPFKAYNNGVFVGEFISQKSCAIQLFGNISASKYIGYCLSGKIDSFKEHTFTHLKPHQLLYRKPY